MNRLFFGKTELKELPRATHKGEKIVVHKFPDVVPVKKLNFTVERTDGGYWNGSRIYRGYVKGNDSPLVEVSVVNSGEGAGLFHKWAIENRVKIGSFEQLDKVQLS